MSISCHAFLCYNFDMMRLHVLYDYKGIYPELSGKALTDALIRRCLGREDAVIYRTEQGKPYVRISGEEDCAGLYISVSHSGSAFAMLEADKEAGLDIQYKRNIHVDRIAERFFTQEEKEYITAGDTTERFFQLWTRKEAYSKYTGAGIEQVVKKETILGRSDVRFNDFQLEDGCFCSVCIGIEEGDQNDEIQISYGK